MGRVKIADLKNNLSRHLAVVRGGAEIIVLDRETPVARIIPFDRRDHRASADTAREGFWTDERLTQLERLGKVTRPHGESLATWLEGTKAAPLSRGTSAVGLLIAARRDSTR